MTETVKWPPPSHPSQPRCEGEVPLGADPGGVLQAELSDRIGLGRYLRSLGVSPAWPSLALPGQDSEQKGEERWRAGGGPVGQN